MPRQFRERNRFLDPPGSPLSYDDLGTFRHERGTWSVIKQPGKLSSIQGRNTARKATRLRLPDAPGWMLNAILER